MDSILTSCNTNIALKISVMTETLKPTQSSGQNHSFDGHCISLYCDVGEIVNTKVIKFCKSGMIEVDYVTIPFQNAKALKRYGPKHPIQSVIFLTRDI